MFIYTMQHSRKCIYNPKILSVITYAILLSDIKHKSEPREVSTTSNTWKQHRILHFNGKHIFTAFTIFAKLHVIMMIIRSMLVEIHISVLLNETA
jgi:hypothetical protein